MDVNYAISFMSKDWIVANSISILYLISCLLIGKSLSKKNVEIFAKYFTYVFIVVYIIYHINHIIDGTWSLNKRLPFHLCGFSSVITCFILFIDKKQYWFEFLFYAGVLGGLNALLTPLIDNYTGTNFFYIEYFYSHTSIIILPLYMYYFMDMKLIKDNLSSKLMSLINGVSEQELLDAGADQSFIDALLADNNTWNEDEAGEEY